MGSEARIHAATLASLFGIAGLILVLWAYPTVLIYLLLLLVAVLGYGALYLVVAARLDPKSPSSQPRYSPGRQLNPNDIIDDTLPEVATPRPVLPESPPNDLAAPAPDTSQEKMAGTRKKTAKSAKKKAKAKPAAKTPNREPRVRRPRRRPDTEEESS